MSPQAFFGQPSLGTLTGVAEYCVFRRSSTQSTDVAAGDHLKFNSIVGIRGGMYIKPDALTGYTTTLGAASQGRVTLKAGMAYFVQYTSGLVLLNSSADHATFGFYNATDGLNLGGFLKTMPYSQTTHVNYGTAMSSIVEPSKDILLEVRIIAVTGTILNLGESLASEPTLIVHTI